LTLTARISKHNFFAFLWHAGFLALAQNFMDVDTIIPAMIIESGGGAMHIGIMTAIMLGGSSFTQLLFAPYVSNHPFKKKFLLLGINIRVLSILSLGLILYFFSDTGAATLWFIFIFISAFALAGAFSNISYTDILGKSIDEGRRKSFFSAKQLISGLVVLFSAFLARKVLIAFDYPVNFAAMFFIGSLLLLTASVGFWKIKETEPSGKRIRGGKALITALRSELSTNPRLLSFLGYINTQGIILSFLPFVVLYAKESLGTQSDSTGNFLIYKVMGIVSVSLLVFFLAKKLRYGLLQYITVGLSLMLIVSALLLNTAVLVKYVFVLGGVVFSLYTIGMNGVLLEISGRENRALYTGFAGAGNILPALFPLLGAWIIHQWGFPAFALLFGLIVASSLWFIRKIDCRK
jgi:MFS family permease